MMKLLSAAFVACVAFAIPWSAGAIGGTGSAYPTVLPYHDSTRFGFTNIGARWDVWDAGGIGAEVPVCANWPVYTLEPGDANCSKTNGTPAASAYSPATTTYLYMPGTWRIWEYGCLASADVGDASEGWGTTTLDFELGLSGTYGSNQRINLSNMQISGDIAFDSKYARIVSPASLGYVNNANVRTDGRTLNQIFADAGKVYGGATAMLFHLGYVFNGTEQASFDPVADFECYVKYGP